MDDNLNVSNNPTTSGGDGSSAPQQPGQPQQAPPMYQQPEAPAGQPQQAPPMYQQPGAPAGQPQQAPPMYQQPEAPAGQPQQAPVYQQDGQGYQQAYYPQYQQAYAAPKNRNTKALIPIIAVVAVVFVAVIIGAIVLLANLGKTTVDLEKYYQIEIEGYNGYAKASIKQVLNPYDDLYESGQLNNRDDYSFAINFASFLSSLDAQLSKEEKISNGDTVELTFTYNEAIAKELKLKVKNTTIRLKVSDLPEGQQIDPFADLEVDFTGTSPNGKVVLSNNNGDDFIRTIRYSADKSRELRNGDKIVVTASYDEDEAIESGYIVTAETKEYTVSGLPYYLDDKSGLPAQAKTAFEQEFKDRIDSILAERWETIYNGFGDSAYGGEKVSVGTPALTKGYILSLKEPNGSYSRYNRLIIVYKVDIEMKAGKYSSSSATFGKRTGYVALQFTNAGISVDGSVFMDSATSMYSGYSYSASLEELESELVTTQKSSYIATDWK